MSTSTAPPPLGTPIVQPIHHSAAYAFETLADARAVFAQRAGGFTYARTGNPNVAALEAEIARREHGVGAVAASSGQAAVALALLTLTGPARDAHAVVSSRIYGGTVDLLTDTLADTGLEVTFADPRVPRQWEDAVRDGTRVFFLESVANPLTELPELEAIARIAHRHGAVVLVDNTVATPRLCTPGEHGADFVVHSATKYLAGHGGPLGGLLVATGGFDPAADAARWPWLTEAHHRWGGRSPVEVFGAQKAVLGVARCKYLNDLGPCLGATAAHEILQGTATLDVRVQRQSATAAALAATLADHPAVERVHHPSLAQGRQRELYAEGGYRGGCGLLSFEVRGTAADAETVVDGLEHIRLAANIGDVRTLVAHPAGMTHCRLTPEQFRASGITEQTLRLSVGLEDPAELTADLLRALARLTPAAAVPSPETPTAEAPAAHALAHPREPVTAAAD